MPRCDSHTAWATADLKHIGIGAQIGVRPPLVAPKARASRTPSDRRKQRWERRRLACCTLRQRTGKSVPPPLTTWICCGGDVRPAASSRAGVVSLVQTNKPSPEIEPCRSTAFRRKLQTGFIPRSLHRGSTGRALRQLKLLIDFRLKAVLRQSYSWPTRWIKSAGRERRRHTQREPVNSNVGRTPVQSDCFAPSEGRL